MPITESLKAWDTAQSTDALRDLAVVRLPGAGHLPTLRGEPDPDAISMEYSQALIRWVSAIAARRGD